jgi:DHA2 family methylenomycin A resistance protein-like MFS transporter
MPAMTSVALTAASSAHAGLAAGALNTARQLGGAVAVAALGAILNAGGYRGGLVAGSAFAAAVCGLSVLSSVKATRRAVEPEPAEVWA